MNTLNVIQSIYYTRASRTIEKVLVSNDFSSKIFFVYNYEGVFFRVFKTKKEVSDFFNFNIESKYSFEEEEDLDDFLMNLNLK